MHPSLFENHPHPVYIFDRKTWKFLEVNAAAVKKYGYTRREFLSMTVMDVRPPGTIPRARKYLSRMQPAAYGMVFRHRKKNGTLFDLESSYHWLRYRGRDAMLVVARDVTSLRKTARTLSAREAKFHLLVDSVKDYAIYMLDPRGIVSSWNEGARRLKGYQESEIIGRHFRAFYTPYDRARGLPEQLLRQAAATGRAEDRGWRVRKDGTRFLAEIVISSIRDASGRLQGFGKVTRDTTTRDLAILRAEEAERGRVARELHDGVNQLLAAAKLRVQDEEEALPRGVATRAALAGARVILESSIQEVRRIAQNLRPIVLDDLGLKAALRSICADYRRRSGFSVRLDAVRLPDSLGPETELAVFRIVQEALNNAARHAHPRHVGVVTAGRAKELHVTVRDDGKGIPAGMEGFGLKTIRERARFLGGRCEVHTARGRGTQISVVLPLRN